MANRLYSFLIHKGEPYNDPPPRYALVPAESKKEAIKSFIDFMDRELEKSIAAFAPEITKDIREKHRAQWRSEKEKAITTVTERPSPAFVDGWIEGKKE